MTPIAVACHAELDDHGLVAAVRSGSDEAFGHLYTRYQRRITAYIYGMVSDHQLAEDITQDVFMSALRRMRETERPIAFKPWVYEIAKNACIDQFRRSRRGEEISYDADNGLAPADHGRLVAGDLSPDAAVEQKLTLDNLRGAFGGLSQTHHDVLVLREFEGLSYREIGERMGLTRPAVESTLFRARRRLTEEYEELVSGERCRRIQAVMSSEATIGVRDRRRMARHLSHCQGCRRHAKAVGFRGPLEHAAGRAAAMVPAIPGFRWLRGDRQDSVAQGAASNGGAFANVANAIGPALETTGVAWAKAAAAATALLLASIGAGVATKSAPTPLQDFTHPAPAHSAGSAGPLVSPAAPAARESAPAAGGLIRPRGGRGGVAVVTPVPRERRHPLRDIPGGRGGLDDLFNAGEGEESAQQARRSVHVGPATVRAVEQFGGAASNAMQAAQQSVSDAGTLAEGAGVKGAADAASTVNGETGSTVETVREAVHRG